MRFLAMCALLVALPASAFAAGFGPFTFDMSVDQARATAPDAPWQTHAGADGQIGSIAGGATQQIAGKDFFTWLEFDNGQLKRIHLGHDERDLASSQCDEAFSAAVSDLEAKFGAFSAPRDPFEYGDPLDSQHTARGSELRFYAFDSLNQRRGYATWRGDGYVQVFSRFAPRPNARSRNDTACSISVTVDQAGPPLPTPLTPPTPEQFAHAQRIDAPHWIEYPDGRFFVLNLPPVVFDFRTGGDAVLYCLVIEEGRLNCALGQEWPRNMWFGQAALNVSRRYRIATEIDGAPTLGKSVILPVHFAEPRVQAPPAADLAPLRRLAEQQPTQAEIAAADLIETPTWVQRPTGEEYARYYPPEALDQGEEGHVDLDCIVQADGALRCRLGEESPRGEGFGLAALGIAQAFRVAPAMDGAPTPGKRVHVTLAFRVGN